MEERKESYSRMTLEQRQVMATGFALKYRDELIDIERRIKEIAGNHPMITMNGVVIRQSSTR